MRKLVLFFASILIGGMSFGQIFITELSDPNDDYSLRYLELYNAGDTDVDLNAEGYGLLRYTNANTDPQHTIYPLTGVIPAKGFYVVARWAAYFKELYGFPPNQEISNSGSVIDNNGDDKTLLLKMGADTVVIDIYGVPGIAASGTCQWYQDGRAERKASVTTGNLGVWDEANWNVWGDKDATGCTSHIHQAVNTDDGIYDPGYWIGHAVTYVSFGSMISHVDEDGSSIEVCVYITNPDATNATTVEIDMDAASTATNGTDFSSITFPQTLTFPAGSSDSVWVTINTTADTDGELDETVILNLQNPAGGTSVELGNMPQHTVSILDNDLTSPANVGDLIISEIMQNPNKVYDDKGEWFEIHNTTAADIDLLGIKFTDDGYMAESFQITSSLVIPAGGYLLFANNGDAATNGNLPTPDYVYEPGFPFLSNDSDGLVIQCAGFTIDSVNWDGGPVFPDPDGASMSLMVDHLNSVDNDNGANWETVDFVYGKGDHGTPGCSNAAACSNTVISSGEATDITCNDSIDGMVSVIATGFTNTLSYTLTPGDVTNETGVFEGLAAGTYSVSVTDANGSAPESIGDLVVNEPAAITIDSETAVDVSVSGASDGSITVTASGGTGDLVYTLSTNDANTTGVFEGLGEGAYTVSVSDANTCGPVVSEALVIAVAVSVDQNEMNSFSIYPNPVNNGSFTVVSASGADMSVQIYNLIGKQVYHKKSLFSGEKIDVSDMDAGIYLLKINEKGEISSYKLIIQ